MSSTCFTYFAYELEHCIHLLLTLGCVAQFTHLRTKLVPLTTGDKDGQTRRVNERFI